MKETWNSDGSVCRVRTTAQPWRGFAKQTVWQPLAAPLRHSLTDLFSALC